MATLSESKILERAAQNGGVLTWAQYVDICLYDAECGYYARDAVRVGASGDFFTSSSLKCGVFGGAVEFAARELMAQKCFADGAFEFVEIGAEPGRTLVRNARAIRLGDDISLSGTLAVVSNELLDARPFERFRFSGGQWRKRAVDFSRGFANAAEVLLDVPERELSLLDKYFGAARVEGFNLDFSFDAAELFEKICRQPWRGALVFADYFRTAAELALLPSGTARTYFGHTQGGNLLENAGLADITYSPCSDVFIDIARACGRGLQMLTQEAFIVECAGGFAEKIVSNPDPTDPRKRELCQLVSPAHMGACFRVVFG